MAIRQGVTASEEHKLKTLIARGKSWEDIVALCQPADERGNPQTPILADVDLATVKKHIYDPLVKKHEEAKKAGHKDLIAHERDTAAKKAAAKKAAAKDEE